MVSIEKRSGCFQLTATQVFDESRKTMWDFLSDPGNLKLITPEHLNFEITTPEQGRAYAGMIISYRVSPVPGTRVNWVTEITQVEEGKYFIDEQRVGPYSIWHHQHHLEDTSDGIQMRDIVTYRLPGGWLGNTLGAGFVRKQLMQIFEYREKILNEHFKSLHVQA